MKIKGSSKSLSPKSNNVHVQEDCDTWLSKATQPKVTSGSKVKRRRKLEAKFSRNSALAYMEILSQPIKIHATKQTKIMGFFQKQHQIESDGDRISNEKTPNQLTSGCSSISNCPSQKESVVITMNSPHLSATNKSEIIADNDILSEQDCHIREYSTSLSNSLDDSHESSDTMMAEETDSELTPFTQHFEDLKTCFRLKTNDSNHILSKEGINLARSCEKRDVRKIQSKSDNHSTTVLHNTTTSSQKESNSNLDDLDDLSSFTMHVENLGINRNIHRTTVDDSEDLTQFTIHEERIKRRNRRHSTNKLLDVSSVTSEINNKFVRNIDNDSSSKCDCEDHICTKANGQYHIEKQLNEELSDMNHGFSEDLTPFTCHLENKLRTEKDIIDTSLSEDLTPYSEHVLRLQSSGPTL